MSAASKDARVKLAQNKKLRRRWLTWLRMARYGANNFTRNAWLTTAATAVMTITLLIIFTTFVARNVLSATVNDLREKLDIPVYLQGDTPDDAIRTLRTKLYQNQNVANVTTVSRDEARDIIVEDLSQSGDVADLESLGEIDQDTAFPIILNVNVRNFDEVESLQRLVDEDSDFVQYRNPAIETTFEGERLSAINTISGWARTAERVGIVGTVIFVAISMLIVFNTIRMAIFNRKEEIQMMKLIGADKSFIRGPFVVEAVMYGFIAALTAVALGYFGLLSLEPRIASYGIAIAETKGDLIAFAPLVLVVMICIGAIIGIISSRLAVRRYLKV